MVESECLVFKCMTDELISALFILFQAKKTILVTELLSHLFCQACKEGNEDSRYKID